MNYLILGGSGYIGSAITNELVKNNHKVFSTYYLNRKDHTEFEFDIFNNEHLKNIDNLCPALDGIVFCLAPGEKEIFEAYRDQIDNNELSHFNEQAHQKIMQAHGTQTLKLIQLLLPKLKKSMNPNIIFLSNIINEKAIPTPISFALTKSLVTGHLRSLSKELGPLNIKVNSINPGILTGGISQYLKKQALSDYMKHTALKRFGDASEVAKVSHWILTKNTYITGQPFLLDGGL